MIECAVSNNIVYSDRWEMICTSMRDLDKFIKNTVDKP